MFRGLGDMADALHLLLPPWAVAAVFAAVLVAVLPAWLNNVRIKQIRGTIRRMVRAAGAERTLLADRALGLAASRPARLVAVVEQATKYDQRELLQRALSALDAVDAAEAARLRFGLQPDERKKVHHPLEVAVRAERLLEEGLVEAAAEQLAQALARSPDDPDLQALARRVEAGERSGLDAER